MALSPDQRRRLLRMNMLMAYASFASSKAVAWTPATLFANAEVGGWYDPSDLTTLFQDAAGTTPVTAVEQPVGRVLDKSGRGNHLSQSTSTARPVLSARYNLFTQSENFTSSVWQTVGTTSKTNATNATIGGGSSLYQVVSPPFIGQYTLYIRLAGSGTVTVGLTTNGLANRASQSVTLSATPAVITVSGSLNTGDTLVGVNISSVSGATIVASGADLRPANAGVGLPAYQRVGAATSGTSSAAGNSDYDTTGFPLYLKFDGTDDVLVSGTITPGSVDKAQVFAGVRKLSDAAVGMVAELSTAVGANSGSFALFAPVTAGTGDYDYRVKGSTAALANIVATYSAPITNVVTGLNDISGDISKVRVNGTEAGLVTLDQGTGNFGSYPLYVGSRAGTASRFNGHLYSLILRFSATNMDAATISSTETWVNQKTLAY